MNLGPTTIPTGDPVKTYAPGRVCGHPLCKTRLSVYNPSAFCALHEPLTYLGHRFKVCPDCGHEVIQYRWARCKSCHDKARSRSPLVTCTRCGDAKPLVDFAKSSSRRSGYASWCRECDADRKRTTRKDGKPDAVQRAQARIQNTHKVAVVAPNRVCHLEVK